MNPPRKQPSEPFPNSKSTPKSPPGEKKAPLPGNPSDHKQEKQPFSPSPPAYQLVSSESIAAETDYKDQLLRLRAEFDNYRKRQQKEREEAVAYANEAFIQELLPILDSFELGMKAAANAQEAKDIAKGMEMVQIQFQKFLTDVGVQPIDAIGQPFDPNLHDAVAQQSTQEAPEGTVLDQHRKGYKLKDRLIRPASVIVAQAAEASAKN